MMKTRSANRITKYHWATLMISLFSIMYRNANSLNLTTRVDAQQLLVVAEINQNIKKILDESSPI